MEITERNFEKKVIDILLDMGYPSDSIATEWKNNNRIYDILIIDTSTQLPLMIIECKNIPKSQKLSNVFNQLKRYESDFDYPIKLCAAIYRDETNFEFYDFTRKIYSGDTNLDDVSATEVPTYHYLKLGVSSKQEKAQSTKRKKYINELKIVCWGVIPLLIIGIIILDILKVYQISTERLFIYGFLLLSLLIPFFGEVKVGNISLIQKQKKDKEGKDNE